jgi:hypothetical protein
VSLAAKIRLNIDRRYLGWVGEVMASMQLFFRRQSDSSLIVGRIIARTLKQNIQLILFLLDALASVSCARNW